ncbi:MAG TPA: HAMP domain-containing sensor histidine kinase [Solirubrobacteraceae bacterium]|jgi:two-component system sensor histidine kinase MprB|nr:HAMP domain-containing sensor histidine kinase [Solirubrobacteraceae bacterium]
MPLRKRISLVAAATVAVAVAIAVLISYFVVRDQLLTQVDNSLRAQAAAILSSGRINLNQGIPGGSPRSGGPAPYQQVTLPNGLSQPTTKVALPDVKLAESVANGFTGSILTTVPVGGTRMRMYIFGVRLLPAWDGQTSAAIQLAQPLNGVANVLGTLRWVLALVFLLVVGLAAMLARMATRRVLKPLAEVTATAQLIAETDDLSQRIYVHEDDEVGQLATRFNEMLQRLESSRGELDASVTAQRQLVADASHELRTPVTSLRTNIEVLLSGAELDDEDRNRLLADVVEQSEELSALVSDLIEVARGDSLPETIEDTRLDTLVEEAIDRARRNAPHVQFVEHLEPVSVQSNPERLIRAINNLLDNAALHAGQGGPVEVTVDKTGVTVRDHGEGIAETDLPHVFDRFYRGANSRARQGSGLGLAIVRQVVEQHHGSVTASNAEDGGAVFTLQLPTSVVANDARVTRDAEVSA